ncbi:MAG: hypothetical protein ACXVJE_19530 [Mucilaginibacter sp.]
MAKNDDILNKVINIAIVAAVVIGLWYLYKWAKDHIGGNGGTLFGGSGKEPGGNADKGDAPKTVAEKIVDNYNKTIAQPTRVVLVANLLHLANKSAKKYDNKSGTDIVINKALKSVNALDDTEFTKAINQWLYMDKLGFYESYLAGAKITGPGRSAFLTRYHKLTGM